MSPPVGPGIRCRRNDAAIRPHPPLRDDAARRSSPSSTPSTRGWTPRRRSTPHRAMRQWESLRQTYQELGHTVELVEPVAGLPDMVYAANGGLLVNGTAVVARFAYPQRAGEAAAYAEWMTAPRLRPRRHAAHQRGSGRPARRRLDRVGGLRIPHRPPRTRRDRRAVGMPRRQPANSSIRASTTSTPRWPSSTTAPSPTTRRPSATSRARQLRELFPDAIEVATADAYVLGLNVVSDGLHVVHPGRRHRFRRTARRRRVRPDRRRSVRAAQGRRIRQMLHAGGVFVTILEHS